ncbi:GyrI-like domain-containing protein [Chryseolinea sp. T2]|uniref:GyrI-like domain-containing protein n=1 Tax=Chryseolinea sp. T2 TaxID=3129255 RepID=UPI0030776697
MAKEINPRIETSPERKLVGTFMVMSLANYKVGELWKSFRPRRSEIISTVSNDFISMVCYSPEHFVNFKPTNEFEKWAAVEVSGFDNVPAGMETFVIPAGLYAVFQYKGLSTDNSIFQYIFGTWLPASGYSLDNRPHFEVLGGRYRNNDPESEEEIWIPIKN